MGRFDVNNKEMARLDAKSGKLFGNGNTVRREMFSGTRKTMNALQAKFDCGEGNEGG